jgi:hypothetical protein
MLYTKLLTKLTNLQTYKLTNITCFSEFSSVILKIMPSSPEYDIKFLQSIVEFVCFVCENVR